MSNAVTAPPANGLKSKLALMMFLELFIWGAWFEIAFDYIPSLGFTSWQNGLFFGAFNVGALVALFFSTQFADRKFAAEKFMAASHVVGGLSILGLFFLHPAPGEKAQFWPFFALMLVHSIFYVPTISIANSIAFANLRDPAREFGPVRVWGTIGWIAGSWPVIFILVNWSAVPSIGDAGLGAWFEAIFKPENSLKDDALRGGQRYIFLVSGVASLILAGYSMLLPHTPPRPAAGGDSLAWLKALRLLRHPFVFILFVVTFIDAAVHQSFFVWTPTFLSKDVGISSAWVTPVMKIGQVAEILTMLALGYVLKSLGWRMTMVVGVLGHAARFAVFAYYPEPAAAILVNVLHGICYAFFFATVYIFVDEFFPKDIRSSAQGLFNVLILGIGPFVANQLCGVLADRYGHTDAKGSVVVDNYSAVFQYSMAAALFAAFMLFACFYPPTGKQAAPPHDRPEEEAPPVP
jgi:nucleoside transporter